MNIIKSAAFFTPCPRGKKHGTITLSGGLSYVISSTDEAVGVIEYALASGTLEEDEVPILHQQISALRLPRTVPSSLPVSTVFVTLEAENEIETENRTLQ